MPKYRKKPVVIEAFRWLGSPDQEDDPVWIVDAIKSGKVRIAGAGTAQPAMLIETLEGVMRAEVGDVIIQGVKGEIYPCKNDIFAATYERVDEPARQPRTLTEVHDAPTARRRRTLTEHQVNPANDRIAVSVMDEPGSGGANHHYLVECPEGQWAISLHFQNGPINEVGVNGLTHEVLLAILTDRLRGFQSGPYASRHNALALTALEEAQNWLNRRTFERMARGVEGTHAV